MATGLTEANDLIVEDGTGLLDANSYSDIATADTYANLRQAGALATWLIANESNKVAALIIATAYVDRRWSFAGQIFNDMPDPDGPQALVFPRATLFDKEGRDISEEVPLCIEDATVEYAARSIDPATLQANLLQADLLTQDPAGRGVERLRERVGPLATETWYSKNTKFTYADYGQADSILKSCGILAGQNGEAIK